MFTSFKNCEALHVHNGSAHVQLYMLMCFHFMFYVNCFVFYFHSFNIHVARQRFEFKCMSDQFDKLEDLLSLLFFDTGL